MRQGPGPGLRRLGWHALLAGLLLLAGALLPGRAAAQQRGAAAPIYQPNLDSLLGETEAMLARWEAQGWLIRGQTTTIIQGHPGFPAAYSGPNSLTAKDSTRNTESFDLVLGRRLWTDAEIIAVPTVTRGFGLNNATGIANFPNNEAFRLGSRDPTAFFSRVFVRQTIPLSYDAEGQDDDAMRFAGPLARERITLTAGKVSVWDFFDDNRYAHDARTQFIGWTQVATGAFDYAADARGFTNGLVAEWENGTWAVRQGIFQVAKRANGLSLDPHMLQGWQTITEVDRFWRIGQRPGALRVLFGASRVRSALWNDVTAALVANVDYQGQRTYRIKSNVAINLEQALTCNLGVFLRLGWNDGRAQTWHYTEMDWSVAGGISVNGLGWGRQNDTFGLALNIGGLSAGHRRLLEAGGIGFIIGDGRLRYRPETVVETYYDVALAPGLNAAVNAQLVANPGYNADRGPVPILSLRMRAAF